jgi:hypothetical protein
MSSPIERCVLVVVSAVALLIGYSPAQVPAQCRSGHQQNRSQQRSSVQTAQPQQQYSMLTALQQQNAMLTVLQQQYAILISLQQQYAMLAAAQGQPAPQAARPQRLDTLRTVSYVPRLSDPSANAKRTEFIVISSGRSTTLGNSGDADTVMSSMDETAARKLQMAQMLADAGLAKRFQGKGDEAKAAATARKKLAALSDQN